ncbi:MAG: hypothetical protein DMF87_02585, partial [Acidobacteria bacterium]
MTLPTVWPSDPALWHGTWTMDAAMPAGDCWVDRLRVPEPWPNMTIAVNRTGQSITLDFWAGYEKDGAYTPDVFIGTVNAAGEITASPRNSSDVYKQWTRGPGCYDDGWTIDRGQLSGMLSSDGREVSGNIIESFRAIPLGQIFTIQSHFT